MKLTSSVSLDPPPQVYVSLVADQDIIVKISWRELGIRGEQELCLQYLTEEKLWLHEKDVKLD